MADDLLDLTFRALSDPTRRAILARLRTNGAESITELAEPFPLTQRAISKHISVLRDAGLVTQERDSQRRMSYLRAQPLALIDDWIEDYRALWEQRFDALDEDLARDQPLEEEQ